MTRETLEPAVAREHAEDDTPITGRLPLHAGRPALVPHAKEAHGFGPVLRRRDFRLLWAAQTASQLADKFLMFTLLVVMYQLTGRNSLQSVLMIAYTAPSIVLSAPAGVFADRHDKRSLMLFTNLSRGLLILLIPVAQFIPSLAHQAWPLLLVTVAFSSVGQLFAPAEAASIPLMVERTQIMSATSLFMTTVIVTLLVGVPAAPLCIRLFGQMAPFYIACALLCLAAGCVAAIRTPLRAAIAPLRGAKRSVTKELREGLAILGGSPSLRIGLAQLTVALMVIFTVFALGPAYMATILHRPSDDTYLVLVPATLGMVVTALVLGQATRRVRRARVLVWSAIVSGAVLVGIGLVPGGLQDVGAGWALVPAALLLSTAFGCGLGGLLVPAFTVLQEHTTQDSRGRIFGGIFAVMNTAVAAPVLVAGGLADAFGVDRVVAGVGILLAVLGILAATVGRHRIVVLDDPLPAVA